MVWQASSEARLIEAARAARWRWVGWAAVAFGTLALMISGWFWIWYILREAVDKEFGMFVLWVILAPGLAFFLIGVFMALPAEKAAQQARMLALEKKLEKQAEDQQDAV